MLCWVVRIMFSCSFVVVHVPASYVIVGVTTASNKCSRCRSKWNWDVNSCRCLAKADHAHPCTSVVFWSTNVIICPRYFSFLQEEVSLRASRRSQLLLFCWFSGLSEFWFRLGEFRVPALLYFFEVRDHFLSCFKVVAIMITSSDKA